MHEIKIRLLSPGLWQSREDAERILRLLCDADPNLVPQKWDMYEPVRKPFLPDDLSGPIDAFNLGSLIFTRSKPKMLFMTYPSCASHCRFPDHSSLSLTLPPNKVDEQILSLYLRNASTVLTADFSYFHMCTPAYREMGRANDTFSCGIADRDCMIFVTTADLNKYLPDIYWAMVFGAPYIKLFGKDKLLSCPAYKVEELPGGIIYIQLTESIYDLENTPDAVDLVRNAVKLHLGNNAFFNLTMAEDHIYNVPEFDLESAKLPMYKPHIVTEIEELVTPAEREAIAVSKADALSKSGPAKPRTGGEASMTVDRLDLPELFSRIGKLVKRGFGKVEQKLTLISTRRLDYDDDYYSLKVSFEELWMNNKEIWVFRLIIAGEGRRINVTFDIDNTESSDLVIHELKSVTERIKNEMKQFCEEKKEKKRTQLLLKF